jgi:ankyrin repeat protein
LNRELKNATIYSKVVDDSIERYVAIINVDKKFDFIDDELLYDKLVQAIQKSLYQKVKLALKQCPELTAWVDKSGWTLLHYAAQQSEVEIARLIINTKSPPISFTLGGKLLSASSDCDVHAVDGSGVSALHLAASENRYAICALLLDRGANVNAKCSENTTPLHSAAATGSVKLCTMLLDRGAILSARCDDFNATPFHVAVAWGKAAVASLFIQRGANVHEKMADGRSPLYLAVAYFALGKAPRKSIRLCRLLLNQGAEMGSLVSLDDRSPFKAAAMSGDQDLCDLFLQHGALIGDWDPQQSAFSASVTALLAAEKDRQENALTRYFKNARDSDEETGDETDEDEEVQS